MGRQVDNPFKTLMFTKEYYEYYALELLKAHNNCRYTDLAHIGGNKSPDLQTHALSIGVEVTCAFKGILLKLDSYSAEYQGAQLQDIPQNVINTMLKAGRVFGFTNGRTDVCYHNIDEEITDEEQVSLGIEAIRTKMLKLNTAQSYSDCSEYELFIILHKYLSRNAVERIYIAIGDIYQGYSKQFTRIYILSGDYLYVCEEHFFFPYYIGEFANLCRSRAYTESGMEEKSSALLKQQGHI